MKRVAVGLILMLSMLLCGCSSLLERGYSTVEAHSSKYWESDAGTLRAENYQDIVNDLLILAGQHTETAIVRLYNYSDDLAVAEALEKATREVVQETPIGAYAVDYITSSSQSKMGYYEITVQISYRRSAEQLQTVVNATSPDALFTLLDGALEDGETELAVRIGYWDDDGKKQVGELVEQLRQKHQLVGTPAWDIFYYPNDTDVGLIEFIMPS